MNNNLHQDILEATRLTRAGQLMKATDLLQRMLGRTKASTQHNSGDAQTGSTPHAAPLIELVAETIDVAAPQHPSRDAPAPEADASRKSSEKMQGAPQPSMRNFLNRFLKQVDLGQVAPNLSGLAKRPSVHAHDIVPNGGQFLENSYGNHAGSRNFKLYVPSGYHGQALPLVVMLHGCTQSPDDFAAGTRMNILAEEHDCFVIYPEQATSANHSKCWNWFNATDQERDQGEPSLIAGITRQVMRDYTIDPDRVYVAGLSAGGAAAAIMGATYPDLYAAIGVHSGLACGAARDLPSAFSAMRQGGSMNVHRTGIRRDQKAVPTIIFHGDQDKTVHPRNGDQVLASSTNALDGELQATTEHGSVPGGHAYSRTTHKNINGTIFEQWVIHGAGHAWSGGSTSGSYTDPRGPDATREMLRFFLNTRKV